MKNIFVCLKLNILNYIQPGNDPTTIHKDPFQVWTNLGVSRDAWTHKIKSSSLKYYLSLVNIFMRKINDVHVFLPEILMIKEFWNLIE